MRNKTLNIFTKKTGGVIDAESPDRTHKYISFMVAVLTVMDGEDNADRSKVTRDLAITGCYVGEKKVYYFSF